MSERSQKFISYIIKRIKASKGDAAALRRADNPNTEYQAWEILASFGISLDMDSERLPFAAIAADIARVKPKDNGSVKIGRAIAMCYEDDNKSEQAKSKLRRLLACDSISEVCRILRPLLQLSSSRGNICLDYVSLLDDILWFSNDDVRQRIKARWAQDFYRNTVEEAFDE